MTKKKGKRPKVVVDRVAEIVADYAELISDADGWASLPLVARYFYPDLQAVFAWYGEGNLRRNLFSIVFRHKLSTRTPSGVLQIYAEPGRYDVLRVRVVPIELAVHMGHQAKEHIR